MEVLAARRLTKTLGSRVVLREVDFGIERGAYVTIAGRSGSGKSTLLKLLAGLDRPTSGTVELDGTELARLDDDALAAIRLSKIGLIFQSPLLLPDLSVEENVALPLQIAGIKRKEAAVRARELLASVGVEDLAAKRPNTLSGGEAQRVSIARALANEPSILLADEPTSGLDRANAEVVLDLLERINKDSSVTIVLATHDPIAMSRGRQRLEIEDGVVRWGSVTARP